MKKETKRPGPPAGNKNAVSENPQDAQLHITCSSAEKGRWKQAAMPGKLAEWVRDALNRAAKNQG